MTGPTLFFGRLSPREVLAALGNDLVARGALHPTQLARAGALVDAGRSPATALIDVGAAGAAVLGAVSVVTGLAAAPPRDQWNLAARLGLSVPASAWTSLLAVPIGADAAGRPLIAFADPSRLGAVEALSLPAHAAVVALEADVKDALAVTPSAPKSAVSFLAPPSAVSLSTSNAAFSSSPVFAEATRPALAGTMVGAPPPLTSASAAASPSASPSASSSASTSPSSPFSMTPPAGSTAAPQPTSVPVSLAPSASLAPQPTGQSTQVMVSGGFAQNAPPVASSTLLSGAPSFGPTVGGRCGKFRLERRLGEGGMASVFYGVADDASPPAAIKVVHEHLLRSSDGDELRSRFRREATAMQQLKHENIVGYIDAGVVGGTEYLATEFISGGTLSSLLRRTSKLTPLVAVSLIGDVLRGLEHAHARGVVHRDLKPENLLIDASDPRAPLKIADFGIARVAEGTKLTGTNRIIGTPAYMSPEQASAGAIDARTDLYTTGVILYELCTGRNPFIGDSPMATLGNVIAGNVRPVGDVEPAVAFVVDVVVARLLSLRADDRYATATEVLAALAPVLEQAAPLRRHWSALVNGVPGAGAAAVVDEAGGWARAARAETAVGDRAAAAAYSAFRATSLDPDQRDAKAVLSALSARGLTFTFTRSIDPARLAEEQRAEAVPLEQRRALYRALGDAAYDDGNPRFASQWWRRAVKGFGGDEADWSRLARVTGKDELAVVEHLLRPKETVSGRAWKPAAQAQRPTTNATHTAHTTNTANTANTASTPAGATSAASETPAGTTQAAQAANGAGRRLPPWVWPVVVVVGLVLAFIAGQAAK